MAHLFYDHLVDWDTLTQGIHDVIGDEDNYLEIIEVVETSLHTEILFVILENIPQEKHTEFLSRFHAAPYDLAHFTFIKEVSGRAIEELIKAHSSAHIKKVLEDLATDTLDESK